ncbi:hypothetical protein E3Q22_04393 [Wallemia mellicola]|uniref:Uncharacterized protein n=1 Tax=Wallemia mellicola TaxID=1708541 RepID=A0A4T0RFP4_9BASI|nr:hypothetical protein E3Q24_04360 [Wallemia mellicola]TIB69010.1 hypothetical protein E3Q23_04369 [Wallemia mellicola]TIB73075.1 hypothetical protein E3Q22_04393 [Wallemia mellicola]TIB78633.1 hypothetical protein E3Q21_04374 [Wallemia mellicola]TIB82999.1 hypothetical protein E3Q20_04344 [Wallemia mellicola]
MVNNLNYIQNQQLERYYKDIQISPNTYSNVLSEWVTNQQRDTLSSIVGHPTLSSYMSIADGQSISRTKFNMIEVSMRLYLGISLIKALQAMISPAGPPPEKED